MPPPLLLDPAPEPPQGNTTAESDTIFEELDRIEPSVEEFEDCVLKEVDCLEDKVEDRIQDHGLKGKKMEVLYDSGWFLGEICYYNTHLNEDEDGSCDYIKPTDVDGIEVKILEI